MSNNSAGTRGLAGRDSMLTSAAAEAANTDKPYISVVMVTRNVEGFLSESIESILGQTFQDFEFVIVDFGSRDNSQSIVLRYAAADSRIKFHVIPDCGLAEARNESCFLAQGRYIAIMDADDVALPNRLLWEAEFLDTRRSVGVVGGAVEWINSVGKPLLIARHPSENSELQSALITHSVVWQPTALIRAEAFASVGHYRGAFAPAEDYDLWLRIAEHFEIANLERVVLKYRIHPRQVSLQKCTQQTLGILGAQASASARRLGKPDPLDSVKELTPQMLVSLGVTEARQRAALASNFRQWVEHMDRAGECAVALRGALEFLEFHSAHVDRQQVAEVKLLVGKLWWRHKRFAKALLAVAQAIFTWPPLTRRLVEAASRRIGR